MSRVLAFSFHRVLTLVTKQGASSANVVGVVGELIKLIGRNINHKMYLFSSFTSCFHKFYEVIQLHQPCYCFGF